MPQEARARPCAMCARIRAPCIKRASDTKRGALARNGQAGGPYGYAREARKGRVPAHVGNRSRASATRHRRGGWPFEKGPCEGSEASALVEVRGLTKSQGAASSRPPLPTSIDLLHRARKYPSPRRLNLRPPLEQRHHVVLMVALRHALEENAGGVVAGGDCRWVERRGGARSRRGATYAPSRSARWLQQYSDPRWPRGASARY